MLKRYATLSSACIVASCLATPARMMHSSHRSSLHGTHHHAPHHNRPPAHPGSNSTTWSQAFIFRTTPTIISEPHSSHSLGHIIRDQLLLYDQTQMNKSRVQKKKPIVFIVTDRGIEGAGLLQPALRNIQESGFVPVVYNDIVADPPESKIEAALDLLERVTNSPRASGDAAGVCVCVVGFGGGSSMDVAKVIAYLGHPEVRDTQTLEQIYGVNQCTQGRRLPLIQVPTTAGTGSEVTPISIVTTGVQHKKGIISPLLLPDIAVLDATLTLSIPRHITAATGIDALVHAIEAYTSRIKKNVHSDIFAAQAMRLLGANIRAACYDGMSDLEVRSAMLLGSCYAGMAFANAPVGAVHAIAYPIGTQFHVPHGLCNSLVLPHVLRFNAGEPSAARMYNEINPLIFGSKLAPKSGPADVNCALADNFEQLARDLGIETQLRQVGIREQDLPKLAAEVMRQERLLPNNPREMTLDDALAILKVAY